MIQKRLPRSDLDAWQKLTPATIHEFGGEKNRGGKTHQIFIE